MEVRLSEEVRFLTTRLGEIIREQAGDGLFQSVEEIRKLSKGIREQIQPADIDKKHQLIAALPAEQASQIAHAFSLFFQLVNVCEERARLRKVRTADGPRYSLRRMFRDLREAGIDAEKLQGVLDSLYIQPVLTAHPTEAKRRSVVYQLGRIRYDFGELDEVLETLWQTEEIHHRRPQPLDEVDNTLSYFERSIFAAVASFYRVFDEELRRSYPDVVRRHRFLSFASWVGGDRDGHPHVTPQISQETMDRHRRSALRHYVRECEKLIDELSHSAMGRNGVAAAELAADSPADDGHEPQELFRRQIAAATQKLKNEHIGVEEFLATLLRVRDGLRAQHAWRTASGRIERLIAQVETFGFELAGLDFRDNTDRLHQSPDEILQQLHAFRAIQQRHGPQACGNFVLSMTHASNDVRTVMRLARQVGVQQVDIVPLFETIGDLQASTTIMRELYADAEYRAHLDRRGGLQEVMLGYSDSNKDGGYLAANWFLHEAQSRLVSLADEFGVKLRFFHGKGGSIDRGGGQSHRSLLAQPMAAPGGRIRITEQGEVINLKYGCAEIAQRNLEQLASSVITAACMPKPDEMNQDRMPLWHATMERLATTSFHFYQDLIYRTPELPVYYWQATPIDVIERLSLGSRPSRRKTQGDVQGLRAIPWVFAWTQSRHLLSAWYGIGFALQELIDEDPRNRDVLRQMYREWPFFSAVVDNAQQSLAKADMYIAAQYASLVEQEHVRTTVFGRIREEYERTVAQVLDVVEEGELLTGFPVLKESIQLRNPYVDPLNYLQIRFLPEWRQAQDEANAEELRRLLALTVGGIAYGMKSTG